MSRFMIVTWDGAGNLVPTLGIAQRLVEAGHEVGLLGHRSIDERVGRRGWNFRPFASAPGYDCTRPGDPAEEMLFLIQNVFFSGDVARDTLEEIDRTPVDALLVDALLPSALSAAESSTVPTAALVHNPYCLLRQGPMLDMVSAAIPLLDTVRSDLGLDPVKGIPQLHDRCDLVIAATPREFEAPCDVGANVRFVGPVLDRPMLAPDTRLPIIDDGPDPLVLVSFSTSQMGQISVLQRIVDSLGRIPARILVTTGPSVDPSGLSLPGNTDVVGYFPHHAVLPRTSVVVTHAGFGTVMAALAHGVPLVAMPMGRDQFFNATRIAELGAGVMISSEADAHAIAEAVTSVLGDPAFRGGAKSMATSIAGYGGAAEAVGELGRLAESTAA